MFLLILMMLGVTGLFYFASATQNSGWYWSSVLCSQGGPLCDHPSWLLTASALLIALAMIRSMSEA
jgi:hypothetical protein